MPTNEELLKQLYKQQTQSQQNQQNPAAATSTDSAPASSAAAPAAGAAQGNTPEAPANGQSKAPAAGAAAAPAAGSTPGTPSGEATTPATGTGETTTPTTPDTSGASGGQSLWARYRDYLNKLGDYKTPTPNSQEDYIRQMYEANLAANKSQLESDYNQNLSDLGAEEGKLGSIYYEQQRQAQAEADRNRQAFQEYANARGLNSGCLLYTSDAADE